MEKRDTTGRYTSEYQMSPDIAVDLFQRQEDPSRPLGSADIQSILGWSRGTVHNKLGEAVERGDLATRTVGERTRVWWVPQHRERAENNHLKPVLPTTFEEVWNATYVKGRNDEYKRERAESVYAAYNLLRKQGRASNDELLSRGMEAYPESGNDSERPKDAHWVNYLRDALSGLPALESPPRTTSLWTYIPPGGDLDKQLDVEFDEWVLNLDDITGSDDSIRRQKAMIQLAYNHVRDTKRTSRDQIQECLPHYVAHYADFERFWSVCLSEYLSKGDWIEAGSGAWVYIDPSVGRKLDSVDLDDWVARTSVPGEGGAERRQRASIQCAYNYLRDNMTATRSEIKSALPNYTSYYERFDGLWQYVISEALRESEMVDEPDGGSGVYRIRDN